MARPIVLLHNKNHTVDNMEQTILWLNQYLPGTYIKVITAGSRKFANLRSFIDQARFISNQIIKDPMLKNGFNMICHGRTGLLGRYYLEHYNTPQVYNYISWGTPHMGVYGKPSDVMKSLRPLDFIQIISYHFFYSYFFQKFVPIAGFWRDPLHYKNYLEQCSFLPLLNNEIDHVDAEKHRENIKKLDAMVLINSHNEHHHIPMESCHFGFYEIGSVSKKEKLTDSQLFKEDTLGLKYLADNNKLHLLWANGEHEEYSIDEDNFINNTLPFLKNETPTQSTPSTSAPQEEIL